MPGLLPGMRLMQYRQGEIADVPLITRTIYRLCEEHCTLAARPPYREESPHAACM